MMQALRMWGVYLVDVGGLTWFIFADDPNYSIMGVLNIES